MTSPETLDWCRLHPSNKPTKPHTTPLSILDNPCGRFSPTGAFWVFDEIPDQSSESQFVNRLQKSLIETLNSFPQWAGQLQWAPYKAGGKHTQRFNRAQLTWGTSSDPGVEWKVVRQPFSAETIAPLPSERTSNPAAVWLGDDLPQDALVSSTPLALHNLRDCHDMPGMLVQLTLLQGGGYAVAVKMAHLLADAHSLLLFVNQWAARSRGEEPTASASAPEQAPYFNPGDLDARAAGEIDSPSASPAIRAAARALPLRRYDWWDKPGCPLASTTHETDASFPPPHILSPSSPVEAETRAPWETWDFSLPVRFALIHFTSTELSDLKSSTLTTLASSSPAPVKPLPGISRLDALLAHLLSRITRARGPPGGSSCSGPPVTLNVSLDARRRVSPPLPAGFLGSPLFMTHVEAPADAVVNDSAGVAGSLRETMARFTPRAVAGMLHDAAHEVSPQRLWQGFVGGRNVLVTSWLRLGLYGVEFGGGGGRRTQPRYVHPIMPRIDGICQVLDAAGGGEGGMDVSLYLEAGAMERLLGDAGLRKFR